MSRIVYKTPDNKVEIIIPAVEFLSLYGIAAIAKKDVPEGLPFWIVDATQIPTDRTLRDAWEIGDIASGEADGYGSASSEFEMI